MPKHLTKLLVAALALMAPSLLVACDKGPAEKAGESIDKAGQSIKDAVDPPGPAEKMGRALDRAAP